MPTTPGRYEEHQFRKVIPGDIEMVRKRVADVLEDFGYAVLGDNPIQGKRRRTKTIFTATVLEYQTEITIALKPISAASTLATFDYGVEYLFLKGDRQTLEREADAIIAMATTQVNATVCPSCHTENSGAVRFCRVCGVPVARRDLPPELEVMRMSAFASAAHLETISGLVLQLLTLAIAIPMILLRTDLVVAGEVIQLGWGLLALGEILVLVILIQAIRRLNTTLSPATAERPELPRGMHVDDRAALSPLPHSVTEGTTELINQTADPVSIKPARDTDAVQ
jgi:hypothetical protein